MTGTVTKPDIMGRVELDRQSFLCVVGFKSSFQPVLMRFAQLKTQAMKEVN